LGSVHPPVKEERITRHCQKSEELSILSTDRLVDIPVNSTQYYPQ